MAKYFRWEKYVYVPHVFYSPKPTKKTFLIETKFKFFADSLMQSSFHVFLSHRIRSTRSQTWSKYLMCKKHVYFRYSHQMCLERFSIDFCPPNVVHVTGLSQRDDLATCLRDRPHRTTFNIFSVFLYESTSDRVVKKEKVDIIKAQNEHFNYFCWNFCWS